MNTKNQYPMPVVMLIPETTKTGTIYHPANVLAEAVSKLLGRILEDQHLPLIESLGFNIIFPNGQPLPFPKGAYQQRANSGPRHIRDSI